MLLGAESTGRVRAARSPRAARPPPGNRALLRPQLVGSAPAAHLCLGRRWHPECRSACSKTSRRPNADAHPSCSGRRSGNRALHVGEQRGARRVSSCTERRGSLAAIEWEHARRHHRADDRVAQLSSLSYVVERASHSYGLGPRRMVRCSYRPPRPRASRPLAWVQRTRDHCHEHGSLRVAHAARERAARRAHDEASACRAHG